MERQAFNSKSMTSASYDEPSRVLVVEFADGTAYQYIRVPSLAYHGLLLAASKGSYFNHYIRPHYQGIKIR